MAPIHKIINALQKALDAVEQADSGIGGTRADRDYANDLFDRIAEAVERTETAPLFDTGEKAPKPKAKAEKK